MLICSACFRRAVTGLVLLNIPVERSSPKASAVTAFVQQAGHSTWSNIRKGHHIREIRNVLLRKHKYRKQGKGTPGTDVSYPTKITKTVRRTLAAREANNKTLDQTLTILRYQHFPINWESSDDPARRRALEKEIEFLNDPLRLASHISNLLRDKEVTKAVDLIKMSQKLGIKNIVSWNNLLAYLMHSGRASEAINAYNQMKKRGTRPDSYTYMMMLRGLALNASWPKAVPHALSIYNSMDAPNSVCRPATAHSNAMISVCAKAFDFDNMFGVAGKMPDKGRNAPDAWTYTIILSAFSEKIKKLNTDRSDELNPEKRDAEVNSTVIEGRRVWEDVIRKWRAGNLGVDEPLVVAMGHLILSRYKIADANLIFSLVQQTTGIPEPKPSISNSQGVKQEDRNPSANSDGPEEFEPVTFGSAQTSVVEADKGLQPSSAYVQAGNGIFTLCLRAARVLSSIPIGKYYIQVFTDSSSKHKIDNMDETSYKEYFRLLDTCRASRQAGDVFEELLTTGKKDWAAQFAVVVSMNACKRDFLNPNVFDNATRIIDLYEAHLSNAPDPRPMIAYLQIARGITPGQNGLQISDKKDLQYFDPDPEKNMLIRAIQRAAPFFQAVRRLVDRNFRPEDPFAPQDDEYSDYRKARAADRVFLDSARKLAKILQSSVDLVMLNRKRAEKLEMEMRQELLEYRVKAITWLDRMAEWEPEGERGADGWRQKAHGKVESARQARQRLRKQGKIAWQGIDEEADEKAEEEDQGKDFNSVMMDLQVGDHASFPSEIGKGGGEAARAG